MKKYFISYQETRRGTVEPNSYFVNELIEIHPLQWQIDNRVKDFTNNSHGDYYTCQLLWWNEVTEEEFEMYKEKLEDY